MSNTFKKTTLGAALAVALCAAPSAFAFNVLTTGNTAPEPIATQVGPAVTMTQQIQLNAQISDNLIGRTTGFGVRMTLNPGIDIVGATLTAGPTLTGPWVIGAPTIGAGAAANTVIWSISAGAGSTISAPGIFVNIDALDLTDAPGSVTGFIEVFDPATNVVIASFTSSLISRTDGLATTCVAGGLDQIDVGVNATFTDQKTGFVGTPYTIGGATHTLVDLGVINLATSGGYLLDVAAAGDTFYSQVTGTDLSAFDAGGGIFLATDATCTVAVTDGGYTIAGNVATLDVEFADLIAGGAVGLGAAGGDLFLCADADGATVIAAQTLAVLNGVNGEADTDAVCSVMPLEYNGSVVEVYHLNPAGNTAAQSFLRVINPSSLPGLVTVEGIDDGANAAAAPITFMLGAGESKQLNSEVLENGGAGVTGAWGDGEGKWRATVTGEFYGMRVQGLNRNTTDNTVTNLTDADGKGEQILNRDP